MFKKIKKHLHDWFLKVIKKYFSKEFLALISVIILMELGKITLNFSWIFPAIYSLYTASNVLSKKLNGIKEEKPTETFNLKFFINDIIFNRKFLGFLAGTFLFYDMKLSPEMWFATCFIFVVSNAAERVVEIMSKRFDSIMGGVQENKSIIPEDTQKIITTVQNKVETIINKSEKNEGEDEVRN